MQDTGVAYTNRINCLCYIGSVYTLSNSKKRKEMQSFTFNWNFVKNIVTNLLNR